ncbi:acyltransferase family protein [Lacticaseibacillus manihotivorans]|uniref:acyltransferase family protein n=1 Tax=Lacticaseibacillus manihotivorans TaxID=88233 RepID=UPI0006D0BAED
MKSQTSKKSRNFFLDFCKAITIILVVFGHNIQYGSGTSYLNAEAFFQNPVFKFIYSFHMPLFALISGYLFSFSVIRHSSSELILRRSKASIVPLVFWNIVVWILQSCQLNRTSLWDIRGFISSVLNSYWFIWGIFLCSIFIIVVRELRNYRTIILFIAFVLLFFLPKTYNLYLYGFIFPYFVIGFFGAKNQMFFYFVRRNWIYVEASLILIYLVLLNLYNLDSYIYTSGISVATDGWKMVLIDLYRWGIGFVGATLVICTLWKIQALVQKMHVLKKYAFYYRNEFSAYLHGRYVFD